MAYTAAYPQTGSSSAEIQVIGACDIEQAASTGEIPLLYFREVLRVLSSPGRGGRISCCEELVLSCRV